MNADIELSHIDESPPLINQGTATENHYLAQEWFKLQPYLVFFNEK